MSYQSFWLKCLRYFKELETKRDEIWKLGDIKAHIANVMGVKKEGGTHWVSGDFFILPGTKKQDKVKPSLKEARKLLGSTFKMNDN